MSHGNPNRFRPKRGRPRDATRDAALLAGYMFYHGKPCRKGHSGKRYTSLRNEPRHATLESYKQCVRSAYGSSRGVTFGTFERESI